MKASFRSIALVAFAATELGCANAGWSAGSDGTTRLASEHAALSVQRLKLMNALSAFDAVQTMPSYSSQVNRSPAPRVVLVLDGSRAHDLEMLKSIPAVDLFEIRVIGDVEAAVNPGDLEVVVTTLARHNNRVR